MGVQEVNVTKDSAFLREQVVQVYPQLMAGEVLIQDAASLAARGEELTYWQVGSNGCPFQNVKMYDPGTWFRQPHACAPRRCRRVCTPCARRCWVRHPIYAREEIIALSAARLVCQCGSCRRTPFLGMHFRKGAWRPQAGAEL